KAGILEEFAAGSGSVTHRFVHALVRDAAYDSQEKLHDLQAAHLGVAKALVGLKHPDAGLIAQHFEAAQDVGEALTYYVQAVTDAAQSAAPVEAIRLLDRAIALLASLPASADRDAQETNLRMLRGFNHVMLGGYAAPGAAEDYQRAL